MAEIITEYAHFFTATNLEWKKLLLPDTRKDVIHAVVGMRRWPCAEPTNDLIRKLNLLQLK